jgi:hypothetical protein
MLKNSKISFKKILPMPAFDGFASIPIKNISESFKFKKLAILDVFELEIKAEPVPFGAEYFNLNP